ncbi:uncharacterized protein LOC100679008 [Nasonia vitripennis]|uniref:Ribosomal protein eL8/eL30/eS12/Gadd45 domain-containing protein n=1 Tax=Nasonia vitripennis TaxID=7425 RepID=A0A7M7H9J7_NASVI|nr:uncharacterized protein LOC100679008 [Nasonia vitripennis]
MTSTATPVLSKAQQRKSLSAKKGPIKGLKNVLAQPYENYWPLLKNDEGATLEKLLQRLLPVLKRSESKVPWSQLRKVKKEERAAARRAAQVNSDSNYDEVAAKSVVFGVNAVTRLLEKDNASCILLDGNVDPSLLVKHVVVMAKNKDIPVILLSFLKRVTLETIGFASAAIGLKKDVKDTADNYFFTLLEKVSELSSDLSRSKTPVALFQENTQVDDEENKIQVKDEPMEEDIKKDAKPHTVSTDVYLYRTSKKERVFQPANASKEKPNIDKSWCDYIALDNDGFNLDERPAKVPLRFFESVNSDKCNNSDSDKVQRKTTKKRTGESHDRVSYKPLKVKRLKGNESRTKAIRPPKVKKK